ncbi:MAG: peptidase S10 [Phycisphaerae bacterium]|nr:peptidase S10 [Phycisphaerae bacterium]
MLIVHVLMIALLPLLSTAVMAQDDNRPTPEPTDGTTLPATSDDADDRSVTTDSMMIDGRRIDYRTTAGMQPLLNEAGEVRANIFHVAYERLNPDGTLAADDPTKRPITFCFNGGPGSSSVWLHLGAWGPVRVDMGDAGSLKPSPWELVENDGSILDVTDLVFIDPVTTGFSRSAEDQDDGQFHGLEADAAVVAEFIRLYLTRHERWLSPKYIAGESYGTTRAARLADLLQDRHGIFINGVILVSPILDFQTTDFAPGNDVANVLYLPTYAATAWYHGHRPDGRSLEDTISQAESFGQDEYLSALFSSSSLADDRRQEIARRLADLTGLSSEFLLQANLRIYPSRFRKELLRNQRLTVGRLDSRFTGIDPDAAGDRPSYDPSYSVIQGPYTAAMNHYVRVDLGFESDVPYEILSGRVYPWDMNARNEYLDVSNRLTSAMVANPELRVFVAEGLYDLATPFWAADYTVRHMRLEPDFLKHVMTERYESGHMMYLHDPSRIKLREDLVRFYESSMAPVAE